MLGLNAYMLEVLMRLEVYLRRAAAKRWHQAEMARRRHSLPAPHPVLVRHGRRRMHPAH